MANDDPFAQLKTAQREGWSLFAPLEALTTAPAAELVRHARIHAGLRVLDVGCGTGVAAPTAARAGAGAGTRACFRSPGYLTTATASTSTFSPKCSGPVGTTARAGFASPAHCA